MSQAAQIILETQAPDMVIISLQSAVVEQHWDQLLFSTVMAALAGKPVLLVTANPPLWDLEVSELGAPIETRTVRTYKMLIARLFPGASGLIEAVASQDFRLGSLMLAEQPVDEVALTTFIDAIAAAETATKVETSVSFLECFDNEMLFWQNPPAEALARVTTVLQGFAREHGWDFVQRNAA